MTRDECQELRLRVESEIRSIKLRLESIADPEAALRARKALSYRVALNSRILVRLSALRGEIHRRDLQRQARADVFRRVAFELLDAPTFAKLERAAALESGQEK